MNTISNSPTIVTESNVDVSILPLHFQLKTLAQKDADEKMSIDVLKYAKYIYGKFGFEERQAFPYTWGMDDNVGMNTVELDTYFMYAILPLFLEIENTPKKVRYLCLLHRCCVYCFFSSSFLVTSYYYSDNQG